MDFPETCSVTEAAKMLGVDYKTVLRQCGEGKIAATQVGRVWRVNLSVLREKLEPMEGKE